MFELALDAVAAATGCDRAALGELVGPVPVSSSLSQEALLDRIAAEERVVDAFQAAQVHDLVTFGAVEAVEYAGDGHQPSPHCGAGLDVADALNLAVLTGQNRIHAADAAVSHPELLGLVGTGAVSMYGLRRVCAATDLLEPDQRLVVDRRLAGDAVRAELTPGQLEKAALRRVLDVDPEAADKRAAKARRKGRCVRLGDPADGLAGIFARLRAEEALAVFGRLDRTARGMRADGAERSLDELMADLLVELVTGTAMQPCDRPVSWANVDGSEPWLWSQPPPRHPDDDPAPDDPAWDRYLDFTPDCGPGQDTAGSDAAEADDPAADESDRSRLPEPADGMGEHPAHAPPQARWRLPTRVEVQVVISAATLLGLDNAPGLLRGYGAVPGWVLHDLVDNADRSGARTMLRGLFCDPVDGRLVAMDSTARCFTGGLRRFALYRDQVCRLSGGRIVDVDHIAEHRCGGKTVAANGQGLGKLAHVLKDHPAITVSALPPVQLGDGLDHLRAHAPDVEWTLPSGRTRHSEPPPALGPGSRPERSNYPTSRMEHHVADWLRGTLDS